MLFASISKQMENPYKHLKSDKSTDDSDDNTNEEDDKDEVEDDLISDLEYLNIKTELGCQIIAYEMIYASLNGSMIMNLYPNIIIPPPNA